MKMNNTFSVVSTTCKVERMKLSFSPDELAYPARDSRPGLIADTEIFWKNIQWHISSSTNRTIEASIADRGELADVNEKLVRHIVQ